MATNGLMSAKLTTPSLLMSQFCHGQLGYVACHADRLPSACTNGLMSAKLIRPSQFVSARQIAGPVATVKLIDANGGEC